MHTRSLAYIKKKQACTNEDVVVICDAAAQVALPTAKQVMGSDKCNGATGSFTRVVASSTRSDTSAASAPGEFQPPTDVAVNISESTSNVPQQTQAVPLVPAHDSDGVRQYGMQQQQQQQHNHGSSNTPCLRHRAHHYLPNSTSAATQLPEAYIPQPQQQKQHQQSSQPQQRLPVEVAGSQVALNAMQDLAAGAAVPGDSSGSNSQHGDKQQCHQKHYLQLEVGYRPSDSAVAPHVLWFRINVVVPDAANYRHAICIMHPHSSNCTWVPATATAHSMLSYQPS
eukprot:GHRR01018670.1.p2 GENE.GHRR01018670.1~~GHRR01018670.1.p2  ORF type:complete len:283 (+),score=115.75 GHRR01018670.1:1643-2491(+)